jgi:hypothetical protein
MRFHAGWYIVDPSAPLPSVTTWLFVIAPMSCGGVSPGIVTMNPSVPTSMPVPVPIRSIVLIVIPPVSVPCWARSAHGSVSARLV